jgi:hypothetical protein
VEWDWWLFVGLSYAFAAMFVYGAGALAWLGLRWLLRRDAVRRLLGLVMAGALAAMVTSGTANADSWEVRRLCSQRSAGSRAVEYARNFVRPDTKDKQPWRLFTLELCSTFEFETTPDVADVDYYPLTTPTIEVTYAPSVNLYWDDEACETWQYKRKEDGLYAVVGKCRMRLLLFPIGSKVNITLWKRDIYITHLIGARAYQDFPLPFWIDPANERALDYLTGPAELNRAELERLREER